MSQVCSFPADQNAVPFGMNQVPITCTMEVARRSLMFIAIRTLLVICSRLARDPLMRSRIRAIEPNMEISPVILGRITVDFLRLCTSCRDDFNMLSRCNKFSVRVCKKGRTQNTTSVNINRAYRIRASRWRGKYVVRFLP